MKKKIVSVLLCAVLAASVFSGCGSKTEQASDADFELTKPEETPEPEAVVAASTPAEAAPEETPEATPEPTKAAAEGQMISYLTGESVDASIGTQRPFAIMINNIQDALPQSGISQAELVYEVEVEGSITRLMCVFQDPTNLPKIGPVRSARHYYVSLNDDNQAIYTHFGASPQAEALMAERGMEEIEGMHYDGAGAFYRTSDRVAPHNAYADGAALVELATGSLGYDRSYPADYTPNLLFNETDTVPEGETAETINIPFNYDDPVFRYDPDTKLYSREEYGAPHIDVENGEQLKFKNVIVMSEQQWLMEDNVHLDMQLFTTGNGYYFSDGKVVPITWYKPDYQTPTVYFDANGEQLKLNPGKTMFEVISMDNTVTWE
ncbi:MAG: DUF3048 domain-containing protein [Eubacteriales bacterium]|nr:DUF3048 domain-containing protein [Eubacteriales bacterium]